MSEEDKDKELGICCYCQGECNPCSQACGGCARRMTGYLMGWNERPFFLDTTQEDKEAEGEHDDDGHDEDNLPRVIADFCSETGIPRDSFSRISFEVGRVVLSTLHVEEVEKRVKGKYKGAQIVVQSI